MSNVLSPVIHVSRFTSHVLSLAFALLATVASADLEYFYWMVDQSVLPEAHEFSYAQLAVLKDDGSGEWTRVTVGDADVYMGSQVAPYTEDVQFAGADGLSLARSFATAAVLDDWQDTSSTAYAFQLELFNADWDSVYTGLVVSYEDLVYARFSGGDIGVHTWNAVAGAPIPEPTGGTLALLGLALLGLRRKRFKSVDAMT